MRTIVLVVLALGSGVVMAQEAAIRQVLKQQEACWNQGNLECFMQGYWQSDSLVFVGTRGVTYGWQATIDNYQEGYPDRQTMGTLTFDLLELRPLEANTWLVLGQWSLQRADPVSGHFTLLFQRKDERWVIVADHSS